MEWPESNDEICTKSLGTGCPYHSDKYDEAQMLGNTPVPYQFKKEGLKAKLPAKKDLAAPSCPGYFNWYPYNCLNKCFQANAYPVNVSKSWLQHLKKYPAPKIGAGTYLYSVKLSVSIGKE